MTNIIQDLEWRYTTKAYDTSKKISDEDFKILLKSLEIAPTSINAQASRYFIASSSESLKKIADATKDYAFNTDKILNSSHTIVFTSKVDYTNDDVKKLVQLEQANKRLPAGPIDEFMKGYNFFVNMHRHDLKDVAQWLAKQTYLTLGVFLCAAANLRIDSTVIEGIDLGMVNNILGLQEKGLSADFVVSLGYRSNDDNNSPDKTKKSRFPADEKFFTI